MKSATISTHYDLGRRAAVNGYIYVAVFMAGFVHMLATSPAAYPAPWSSTNQILAFYTSAQTQNVVNAITQALAGMALMAFTAVLSSEISRHSYSRVPTRLVQAGGMSAGIFLLLSAISCWLLARPEIIADVSVLRLVQDFSFATGGIIHILSLTLLIGTPSAVAIGIKGWLPKRLGLLGVIVVVAAFLGVFSFAFEAAAIFLPIARFASFAWIVMASTILLRNAASKQPANILG